MSFRGEECSNQLRVEAAALEPRSFRTYTPTLTVAERSAGSYLWTPEGRMLADFTSGVLVTNLGHHPIDWWKSVLDHMGLREHLVARNPGAASAVEETTPAVSPAEFLSAVPLSAYNALTELEVRAAENLIAVMRREQGGGRIEQVAWAASGSEAVQKALWMAQAFQQDRPIILATRGGFHGKKGLAGAVSGSEDNKSPHPDVRFISFPQEECRDTRRRREPLELTSYQAELNSLWQEHGSRIGCLITEPYLGAAGSFHPQPEYLQLLEKFCREHDVLFILDEIQSNFGRTGELFAFTTYGIEPDIVCLGKGLGNGIPVAATCGRADVFGVMDYGETSDTYSGNPLSCAAVLATLEAFADGSVMERARELTVVLEAGLVKLEELPIVAHVRGEGGVWGVECAGTGEHSADDVANTCVRGCYVGDSAGRAIHLLGPLAGNVIRVSPPLSMVPEEAEEYLAVMYEVFENVPENLS
ncbi:MAG: aspartate aminotransferase family protein [Pirellulales bacterium]|nr:aspartate aminotransferase family protein [Pirellulales bacterium]